MNAATNSTATFGIAIAGALATVTLHRPEVRNAFHENVIVELTRAFHELGPDSDIRAIVLAANGVAFFAGADLNWVGKKALSRFWRSASRGGWFNFADHVR